MPTKTKKAYKKTATIPDNWDLNNDTCPYGHKLTLCYRQGYQQGRIFVRQYCDVIKAQMREEQKYARKPAKVRKPLNLRNGRLAKSSTYNKPVPILLVCEHEVFFDRNHISFRFSTKGRIATEDPPMFCIKCDEYRKIHQIDHIDEGNPALVVWPLFDYELPEVTPLNTGWQI